jgi:spore germination protein YaaH
MKSSKNRQQAAKRTTGRGYHKRTRTARRRGRRRSALKKLLILLLILCLLAGGYGAYRYMPSGEEMDLYAYFGAESGSNNVTFVMDGTAFPDEGIYIDGEIYAPSDWVSEYLTPRFYWDEETAAFLYTDGEQTWEYVPGQTSVTSDAGGSMTTDRAVAVSQNGQMYLWLSYCVQNADTNVSYFLKSEDATLTGPDRAVFTTGGTEYLSSFVMKNTPLRYRGGIKSPILKHLQEDEDVTVLEQADDWTQVLTKDGLTGYVKSKYLTEPLSETAQHTFDGAYSHVLMGGKVVLGWLTSNGAVLNAQDNGTADPTAHDELTVVSPTWYTITDTDGNVDDTISADLLDELHGRGLSVWPLISDFTQDVDMKALLGSRAARQNLIDRLMSDADEYGYDGINLDFEAIKEESGLDFLQFVRELSVECRKRKIVLSADNYVPIASRSYYNYSEQSKYLDYVIMMDYDEHWSTSEPGSVSSRDFFSSNLSKALTQVDKSQLICGVPFYTRIYAQKDGQTSGQEASMQGALTAVEEAGAQKVWDESLGQYTAQWSEDGTDYSVWLEEERSFTIRMDTVKDSGCAGIACWQLGRELPSIWDIIAKGLN